MNICMMTHVYLTIKPLTHVDEYLGRKEDTRYQIA